MKTNARIMKFLMICLLSIMAVSCNGNNGKLSAYKRVQLKKELTSFQKTLPIEYGIGTLISVELENDSDYIVYTFSVLPEAWELMGNPADRIDDDNYCALMIKNFNMDAIEWPQNLGLKARYINSDTRESVDICINPKRINDISAKIKSGEIKPYTFLQALEWDIAQMQFPIRSEDGYITDAYIDGHNVCFEYTSDYEIDESDIDPKDLKETKDFLIEGLKSDSMYKSYQKEIIEEDIHFIYVLKNDSGNIIARIDISPQELFNIEAPNNGYGNLNEQDVNGKVIEEKSLKPKEDEVFRAVDQMPQFPGGEAALMEWIATHIQYPIEAAEEGAQGKVTIQFVVTKDGSIGQVIVARGRHPALDKEAVRVVKTLPKFIPGKMNGQAVNVWYTLPINFSLE